MPVRQVNNGFICYARADVRPSPNFVEEIQTHLGPLVRTGQLAVWSDQDLQPG